MRLQSKSIALLGIIYSGSVKLHWIREHSNVLFDRKDKKSNRIKASALQGDKSIVLMMDIGIILVITLEKKITRN